MYVVGAPVHLLDIGIAHVTEERVGETTGDIGVNENGSDRYADSGKSRLGIHARAHGKGRGDQSAGVGIDTRGAAKGTNAQDGELHAAADKQASLQVAHNQTGNHTGEDG